MNLKKCLICKLKLLHYSLYSKKCENCEIVFNHYGNKSSNYEIFCLKFKSNKFGVPYIRYEDRSFKECVQKYKLRAFE